MHLEHFPLPLLPRLCLFLLPQDGPGISVWVSFLSSLGVVSFSFFLSFLEYYICPTITLISFFSFLFPSPPFSFLSLSAWWEFWPLMTVLLTFGCSCTQRRRGSTLFPHETTVYSSWKHLSFALICSISHDGFTKTKTDLFFPVISQQVTHNVSLEKKNKLPSYKCAKQNLFSYLILYWAQI